MQNNISLATPLWLHSLTHVGINALKPIVEVAEEKHVVELVGDIKGTRGFWP